MIPVVGVPYLMDYELLDRCLTAIPVGRAERVHVIDNSPPVGRIEYPTRHDVVISRPQHNIGVAASWNSIIKWNPDARWFFIINADVIVTPDDLDLIEKEMRVHEVVTFRGMHAFGVRASTIQKVGWFDENFVPAYFEDNDWSYRCRLLGVEIRQVDGWLEHVGSASIRSSDLYRRENNRTFPMNQGYYVAKWGGSVGHEVYTTPFDRGGSPRDWTLDMTRLVSQSWKE